MPTLPSIPDEILFALAAAACAALVACGLLALARRRARQADAAMERLRVELVALRQESGAQSATLLGLAGRFDSLQRQLAVDARFATPAANAGGGSAFELAIRLARGGASAEDLVAACMMSRPEAELALRLHGPAARAATPRLAAIR